MKPTAIATTIISALLLGGVLTACNQASSPDSSQTSPSPIASTISQANSSPATTPSDTPQANSSTTPEREQRREARRKQIEAVLTPDQVQQLQAKLKQGEKLRKAIDSLNLTADQKNKIQIVMEKSYEQTPNPSNDKSPQ
jgi:Spy/CpxP family protein refolding chaperone